MSKSVEIERLASHRLAEELEDSPVVLIQGPRQCGKTTLARRIGDQRGYAYLTFDDPVTLESAKADPVSFVDALPDHAVLDEIQRVPELFLPIKRSVDRDRRPGRFLLTGSSDVLLLPTLADSLAGRMAIVRLHPMAQCELERRPSRFLSALLDGHFPAGRSDRLKDELLRRVVDGGYPPALARSTPARRSRWYHDYIRALVERDARDLARLAHFEALPKLLAAAATQTAQLLNLTSLSNALQLSRPTSRVYLNVLERLFLVDELPAWHTNKLARLVKAPKLHLSDTGVAAALAGHDAASLAADRSAFGPLLETFVHNELRRLASAEHQPYALHHFRDKDGVEVDLVVERGPRHVAGVEVKAGATVTAADFAGLRKLSQAAGARFACGVVLYDGEQVATFGERLFAVPYRRLWA